MGRFDSFVKPQRDMFVRDDMILDNQYLADILENGSYPARIPPEQIRNASPNSCSMTDKEV